MIEKFDFIDRFNHTTSFSQSGKAVWLNFLCGLECSANSGPNRTRGLFAIETDEEPFAGRETRLIACQTDENKIKIEWTVGTSGLHWQSIWNLQPLTGIWSRRDILTNPGEKAFHVRRALARFPFAPGEMEIYTQASSWAHENQGGWAGLTTSELTLRSQAGRTNQGASPYLFLRKKGTALGIAFHILPRGNWVIHVDRTEKIDSPHTPCTVIGMGQSDDRLNLEIPASAAFELPEILVQTVQPAIPEMGAPALHRYALNRFFPVANLKQGVRVKACAPVVYNTWFDTFEHLEVGRLRDQLAAAKEIGCEVFVIDAGWYGNGNGPWDQQVGDWSEKREAAFHGQMMEFASEVRTAGLGFGLWMEPERFAPSAPVLASHPDWFRPCPWGYFSPDLSQRSVRDYLLGEISRLVETYRLAWMKVDFNLEMGHAADGLASYYQAWYGMHDELRKRFPETFFEGCASGGMRLELNTLAHFDGHFLSDTVNPVDVLRITQGALLRVPPGRLTRWAVLRPASRLASTSVQPFGQIPEKVITPEGANWNKSVVTDVDFICRVALPGMYGYSGDLAGLSLETRARLCHHTEFYKRWRNFLAGSVCHLLTPVANLSNRGGWVVFQLQNPDDRGASLVFVYRLDDSISQKNIPLRELDPEIPYVLTNDDAPDKPPTMLSGRELTSAGLSVELVSKFSSGVYVVQP